MELEESRRHRRDLADALQKCATSPPKEKPRIAESQQKHRNAESPYTPSPIQPPKCQACRSWALRYTGLENETFQMWIEDMRRIADETKAQPTSRKSMTPFLNQSILVGDDEAADDEDFLLTNRITHVIRCTGPRTQRRSRFKCLHLDAKDDLDYNLLAHLESVDDFLGGASRVKALVSCNTDNCAPALVVAMMMSSFNRSQANISLDARQILLECWTKILLRHGNVVTNDNFLAQLAYFAYSDFKWPFNAACTCLVRI